MPKHFLHILLVAVALLAAGYKRWLAVGLGMASGLVEPLGAVPGAALARGASCQTHAHAARKVAGIRRERTRPAQPPLCLSVSHRRP